MVNQIMPIKEITTAFFAYVSDKCNEEMIVVHTLI